MNIRLPILIVIIGVLLPSLGFALDFLHPSKIEGVIDGDTQGKNSIDSGLRIVR